jgi:lysylphosphatidylglycerol synthetase-like protein (DUF2156 family)
MRGDEQKSLEATYASYYSRMRLIQRWRRVAWISCVLVALLAAIIVARDPGLDQPSHGMLVASLFVFIVALMLAVNFLTMRFRASRPRALSD